MNADALARRVVEIGRRAEEPPYAISRSPFAELLGWLVGRTAPGPLADPRLEVLRALSSAVSKAPGRINRALLAAVRGAGWKAADLRALIPSVDWDVVCADAAWERLA